MCYDVQTGTERALKYAKHRGDEEMVIELTRQLELFKNENQSYFHASGFTHPKLLVFTNHAPYTPQAFIWGLIPAWIKNIIDAKKFWNNTLNARGESIFEKASFKNAAKYKRCIIYLDAFYEYLHLNKQTYPFRIFMKDGSPMAVAGLWEEYTDKSTNEIYKTFSIVTTEANELMKKIHNNPKIDGPRMPLILPKEKQNDWLIDCKTEMDLKYIQSLIKPFDANLMEAYPVGKLKGKEAIGNVVDVIKKVNYDELDVI